MRKTLLLLHLFLLLFFSASAQLSFESSGDFGKLWDVIPDKKVPDRLYARSLNNHIMVSNDRGLSWDIFYSFENSASQLSQLKLLPGGASMSFTITNSPDISANGLYVLDMATKTITRHFETPDQYLNAWVVSYDIYDPLAERVVINTSYMDLNEWVPYTEVYFTKDGSKNWNTIYQSREIDGVHINNSYFAPDDPAKIYLPRSLGARGVNGGLFISTDEGKTWTEALAGKGALSAMLFNPKDPKDFFIGTFINFGASPEALFHTRDGGKTFEQITIAWTDQTLNCITLLQYDPGNNNIIWMLDENEILKSTDGGVHWSSTAFDPYSTVYVYGTSLIINPKNSNDVLFFSDGWPQSSKDGGKTLTQLKMPFCVAPTVSLGNYTSKQQLYYSSQGGYLSKDLTTQQSAAYGIQPPNMVNIRDMKVIADTSVQGRVFLFKASDGFSNPSELYYSDDYGATVHQLPSDQFATALGTIQRDPNNRDRYWVSYSYYDSFSTLFKLDFSDPANPEASPVSVNGNGVLSAVFVPKGNGGQTLFIAVGSKVYQSGDGGVTWGEKADGLQDLMDGYDMILDLQANPFDEHKMAIATTLGIYQTNDSGDKWILTLPATDLRKIAFSDVTNGHIIAGSYSSNFSETRLVFSTNGGTKWSSVSPAVLQYLPCRSMDYKFYEDHADIYFATSDLGVVKYQLHDMLSPQLLFLTSFTGSLQGRNALLEWKTRNEEGLRHYELERSTNNKDFSLINTQQASNSNGIFYYNYVDQEFPELAANFGNVYYRLKLVSEDDSFAYSDTVKLTARDMYLYPIPAHDVINLHVQGVTEAAKYRVLLVDVSGRQYSIQQYNIPAGQTTITMPINRLTSGMYIMLVETKPGDIRKFKFIKL